jgi:hypothetical protein
MIKLFKKSKNTLNFQNKTNFQGVTGGVYQKYIKFHRSVFFYDY